MEGYDSDKKPMIASTEPIIVSKLILILFLITNQLIKEAVSII